MYPGTAAIDDNNIGQKSSAILDGTTAEIQSPRTVSRFSSFSLSLFFCLGGGLTSLSSAQDASHSGSKPGFTGSESCRKCHEELYQGWQQTRMANVVRDPQKHPEAVLG